MGSEPSIHWRDRPLQPIRAAGEIAGVSSATIYRWASAGRLNLKRLGGRTLVETKGLIALVEAAEDWSPAASRQGGGRHV